MQSDCNPSNGVSLDFDLISLLCANARNGLNFPLSTERWIERANGYEASLIKRIAQKTEHPSLAFSRGY